MPARHISIYPILFFMMVLTASCNTVFEPTKKNDRFQFSINGYLDATADTQWVKVMPVRDSLLVEPGPIDATVILEEIGTNKSTTMKDSLFRYLQGGGTYSHIFWSTMNLEPEQTYRLTAERSDGMFSSAEVTLPADFPTPMVKNNYVYIHKSIDRLGDVQTVYHGRDPLSGKVWIKSFPHLQPEDTVRTGLDYLTVYINRSNEDLNGFPPVFKRQIFVAAVSINHPDFWSIDKNVLTLPNSVSNIKNGLGYLAGIVSKTIPYKSCFTEEGTLTPCPTDPPPW